MIEFILENDIIILSEVEYSFDSVELLDENQVNIHLFNDQYNSIYALVSNNVTINGVLQTSGQMIIDTLNGKS